MLVCGLMLIAGIVFSGCKKSSCYWYVQPEFAKAWERVIREANPPVAFKEIQIWEGDEFLAEPGILISSKPWHTRDKAAVYYRLSYDLEYRGAVLLALDPWMVFYKYRNPELTAVRAYSDTGGDGLLLVPGKDPKSVGAWTARLLQDSPGVFPTDDQLWADCEKKLFSGGRFPSGSQTYNWQDVFFRLMGNETAWVYAPLSAIRGYPNPRKTILEAAAFPERQKDSRYSLQASLLWAISIGSDGDKEKLTQTLEWLKKPETQTIIANAIEWIPADPYGKPYDPVSLTSHRNWLTATYIYEINE